MTLNGHQYQVCIHRHCILSSSPTLSVTPPATQWRISRGAVVSVVLTPSLDCYSPRLLPLGTACTYWQLRPDSLRKTERQKPEIWPVTAQLQLKCLRHRCQKGWPANWLYAPSEGWLHACLSHMGHAFLVSCVLPAFQAAPGPTLRLIAHMPNGLSLSLSHMRRCMLL